MSIHRPTEDRALANVARWERTRRRRDYAVFDDFEDTVLRQSRHGSTPTTIALQYSIPLSYIGVLLREIDDKLWMIE